MSPIEDDKRGGERKPIKVEYELVIGGQHIAGSTITISQGGAFLADVTPDLSPDNVSELGQLTLQFPAASITLNCLIIYAHLGKQPEPFASGMGIEFNENSAEKIAELMRLADLME